MSETMPDIFWDLDKFRITVEDGIQDIENEELTSFVSLFVTLDLSGEKPSLKLADKNKITNEVLGFLIAGPEKRQAMRDSSVSPHTATVREAYYGVLINRLAGVNNG